MRNRDLDEFSEQLAEYLLAQAPPGGAQAAIRLDAPRLASQIRPQLTPRTLKLLAGPGGIQRAKDGKFNIKKFLENLGTAYGFLRPILELIAGIKLPEIPIPAGAAKAPRVAE